MIDIVENRKLVASTARETAQAVLMELGLLSRTITRAQVCRTYSRRIYDNSVNYVKWAQKGKAIVADRVEFESYLTKFNIELTKIIK